MGENSKTIIIIGGGIAGLSAAAVLAKTFSVTLLEREKQLGYHASGRSAALFSETYGNRVVRGLSVASRPALESGGFFEHRRGALHVGGVADDAAIDTLAKELQALLPSVRRLSAAEVHDMVSVIPQDKTCGGVYEADAMDIDTNKMVHDRAAAFKVAGGTVRLGEEVLEIRKTDSGFQIVTNIGTCEADIVINASGAWADVIAERAGLSGLGMMPKRRTAFMFDAENENLREWPLVVDLHEQFYFKPDAGRLIGSLADETDTPPCDAYPEDLDIAIAVDRIEQATTLQIGRPATPWAGLRTFSPDRTPVVGFDPRLSGFFWVVGQGGYGFQVSLALADITAKLIREEALPEQLAELGVSAEALAPERFLTAAG
ncbi:MAG: FAD-binding oxidoreductase [Brucellaceae bacterium]|jgi:D-arginine dehydrogenase|nr:FAD-binding oxidoreductase [Brucellaceae bacterium]